MTYPVMSPKRIVTFLGAGASVPFDYPTTKSFLEKLSGYTDGDEKKLLNSIRNMYRTVEDVEHVVEILDLIVEMQTIPRKGRLSTFPNEHPLTLDFENDSGKQVYQPKLDGRLQWKQVVELAEKLREDVEELTFQEYESKVGQYSRIEEEYDRFFSVLMQHKLGGEPFEVFTTNYDNVIEDYSRRSGIPCTLTILNHNLSPEVSDELGRKIHLTKLHGSLDWLIDKETKNLVVATNQAMVRKDSTRWERNEYVLFGTKPRLEEAGIYGKLFDELLQSLLKAEVCIVIGFSFRDDHINKVLNNALLQNSSLRILIVSHSPKEAAKRLIRKGTERDGLYKQKRIMTKRCSFGKPKAIKEIQESLSLLK